MLVLLSFSKQDSIVLRHRMHLLHLYFPVEIWEVRQLKESLFQGFFVHRESWELNIENGGVVIQVIAVNCLGDLSKCCIFLYLGVDFVQFWFLRGHMYLVALERLQTAYPYYPLRVRLLHHWGLRMVPGCRLGRWGFAAGRCGLDWMFLFFGLRVPLLFVPDPSEIIGSEPPHWACSLAHLRLKDLLNASSWREPAVIPPRGGHGASWVVLVLWFRQVFPERLCGFIYRVDLIVLGLGSTIRRQRAFDRDWPRHLWRNFVKTAPARFIRLRLLTESFGLHFRDLGGQPQMLAFTDVNLFDFHVLCGPHVVWVLWHLQSLVVVGVPADLWRGGDLLLVQEMRGLWANLLQHLLSIVLEGVGCQHLWLFRTLLGRCHVEGAGLHPGEASVLRVELRIRQIVVRISVVVAFPKDVSDGAGVTGHDVFEGLEGVALFPSVVSEVLGVGSKPSLILVAAPTCPPDGVILQLERVHWVLWPFEDVDAGIVLLAPHWAPALALPAVGLSVGVLPRSPSPCGRVLVSALNLVYIWRVKTLFVHILKCLSELGLLQLL